jgi:hypothetical protein
MTSLYSSFDLNGKWRNFLPRGLQLPVTDETLRAAGQAVSLDDHTVKVLIQKENGGFLSPRGQQLPVTDVPLQSA